MTPAQRAKAALDDFNHAFFKSHMIDSDGETVFTLSLKASTVTQIREALREQMADEGTWRDIETAPYDTMALFYTVDGHVVQGFIYDGGAEDFGYTHWMPLPKPPLAAQESISEGGG